MGFFTPPLPFRIFCFCFSGWCMQRWLLINDNVATHFLLIFSLLLKIKDGQNIRKSHKRPETCCGRMQRQRKIHEWFEEKYFKWCLKKEGSGDTTNTSNETTSPATNTSNETTSHTTNVATIRSNDTYVYGVGMLAVLAIGVCVFFAYNTFQSKNKKLVNEKQDQLPKRRHML